MSRDFRRYAVYHKAHQLVLEVYRRSEAFPDRERFGVVSQLRRAALSIPTNLAEGAGRTSDAEFARFVDIALGSGSEVEYLLVLSGDLGYLSIEDGAQLNAQTIEVKKMLHALARRLRADRPTSRADS
jgi:four helix bundle protein